VNASVESFKGAVQTMAERSTHSIFAETGTISDQQYVELARRNLPYPMAPVIDRGVLVEQGDADTVARLLGVDVFSERSLRSFTQMQSSLDPSALRAFLTEPGSVVLVDQLAARLHVRAGDNIQLAVGSRLVEAHIVGIVEPTGVARAQLTDLIIADLATAQELTGDLGKLDRVDVLLDNSAQESSLRAALPPGLVLRSMTQRAQSLSDLIGSYKLNLNALSLMASFVAIFIVYNSMLISVRQRLTGLGILRCLGASRRQLGGVYLGEALLFSLFGGVLGVIGGWLLSRGLVGYVATTINDLYAPVRPGPVRLGTGEFVKGLSLSTVSCLLGAAIPLVQASRTPPVNAFRTTAGARASGNAARRLLVLGLTLIAASYGVYCLPIASPVVGFVMAVLVALGFAFACPGVIQLACRLIAQAARPAQLLSVQMAGSGVSRSLGITGVAVAATMLAMSMNIGVRTMVRSFRGALSGWIEQSFAADIFVAPELLVNHKVDATVDPAVRDWVARQPQTARMAEFHAGQIAYAGHTISLTAANVGDLLEKHSLQIKSIDQGGQPFDPAKDVMISEPLSGWSRLGVGNMIELNAPTGNQRYRVFGVFFDFGSERGQVMIDRHTYAAAWNDDSINSLHVWLKPGYDGNDVAAAWSANLRRQYPVVVNSFQSLKIEILTVFDRTFKVTDVLTWLAGAVAFCGLAGSLLAVSLARQKDYSVLAAVGMSGWQTSGWVLAQGLIMAWISAIVAAAAGTMLAYVLAYVIQYRSFGWSIPVTLQPKFWIECLGLATLAAIVAAIYPVYRLRSAAPAGNLRQE
jgi:putative ABC transport system permease protein